MIENPDPGNSPMTMNEENSQGGFLNPADHNIDPTIWKHLFSIAMKPEANGYSLRVDAGYILVRELQEAFEPKTVTSEGKTGQAAWAWFGRLFFCNHRAYESLALFESLYRHMLTFQEIEDKWTHKGMPLVFMSDCFAALKCPVHAKRYLMYTLCEDAAFYGPELRTEGSGVYFRALWQHGMPEQRIAAYTRRASHLFASLGKDGWFPEHMLAELDDQWMTELPSETEHGKYLTNHLYIEHLIKQFRDGTGEGLERLACYLLSMIPGCRAYRRVRPESDLDVVGCFEGPSLDFRSEFGRYFICECKDWNKPADVTTILKLSRELDSMRARFGILFSNFDKAISGQGELRFAERELLKSFSHHGIAIIVINPEDIREVAKGVSFLSMIRSKYEMVRFDTKRPLGSTQETEHSGLLSDQESSKPKRSTSRGRKLRK